MATVRRTLLTASLVGFLALFTVGRAPGQIAKDINVINTQNVNVANAPSVNASITNTPNVSVSNTPTVRLAHGTTVAITGTPTVTLNPTSTVPVFDVSNPALQPVYGTATVDVPSGVGNLSLATLTLVPGSIQAVPAGKRLVIEFVSLDVTVPSGQKVLISLEYGTGGQVASQRISTTPVLDMPGVVDVFTASQPVRLYADPGTSVSFSLKRSDSSGIGRVNVRVSGHYVDIP